MATTTTTKGFRETQWFKLGLAPPPVADDDFADGDETDPSATVLMLPVEDRYLDDGRITREDSAMFGLHTGTTEYLKVIDEAPPADDVPMAALVRELKRSRRSLLAIGVGACALVAAFVMYAV